ncbi:MAG: DUF1273 domain-containing protein [Roseburia sp.]|nr:DUF1273 domain-containing protein [Roseburia sp.]
MDKEKTCAFTGHRILEYGFDLHGLKKTVENFVLKGYENFLCGMAVGFDMIAAETVLQLKKLYPHIKLFACVPCAGQEKYYGGEDKIRYNKILSACDGVEILSAKYYNGCMQARDRYMVDNSSLLIAYKRKNEGGTYYTVRYALSENKKICLV